LFFQYRWCCIWYCRLPLHTSEAKNVISPTAISIYSNYRHCLQDAGAILLEKSYLPFDFTRNLFL